MLQVTRLERADHLDITAYEASPIKMLTKYDPLTSFPFDYLRV